MIKQIEEKKLNIVNNAPKYPEFRKWMNDSDLWNFLYCVLKIRGEKLHKKTIAKIVAGEICENLTFQTYNLSESVKLVYKDMKSSIDLQKDLSVEMILKWANILLPEKGDKLIRTGFEPIFEWDYMPKDVDCLLELKKLVRYYLGKKESEENIFSAIASLHLEMNRLYAFGTDTTIISLAVLMFCLLEQGYYFPDLSLSDREYNSLMTKYLEDRDLTVFTNILERSEYNRLEVIDSYGKQMLDNY